MKYFICLVLIVIVLPSFNLRAQETDPITIKLKKSDLEGDNAMLSAVADEISYIKLETHPDAVIGSASRYFVKQIPQGFLIWNGRGAGRIMIFNSDGTFERHIGSQGKGPGEYYGVYKVVYDKYLDEVLVLLNKSVLRYNMNGKFLSSVDIDTKDTRIERMCVKDDHTWLFTYKKPLRESLFEVGILATNRKGKIVKQYSLADETSPGSYGFLTQMNYLYQRENETYYNPFNYFQTYRLNNEDEWVSYLKIDVPFKKIPIEQFKGINIVKMNDLLQEYGQLMGTNLTGDNIWISGAIPGHTSFNLIIDLESREKVYYKWDEYFKKTGLTNNLDGGMPFRLRGFSSEGISLEMIDAVELLNYSENGLIEPDGKDHGPHMNLAEVLESTKADDNPILVVVHVKQ